jgi:3-deoxy-D-manno-octulosonic-acid transferase
LLLTADRSPLTALIYFYRFLFLPALLLLLPYYLWRMRKRGGYGENFSQRFGGTDALPAKPAGVKRIWLHAVSVGEMLAVGPLLDGLKRAGNCEIYLTTTTSTGYNLAKERHAAHAIGLGYFPLDFWPCSARAWRRVQPDLAILMEGERWPEHLWQAQSRGVPVLCVNARLSDRSFRRSLAWNFLLRPLAAGVAKILCSSRADEQRFRALDFPPAKLQTTGNLKLDVAIPLLGEEALGQLRRELGLPAGLVLLGSSTWAGEESALVQAMRAARGKGLAVSLLLVPRHAERRDELRAMLAKTGLRFHFRSEGAAAGEVDVAVGDTTGELQKLTQLADVVFVGKSLAPHNGGQTPVEAAVLGKPVVHGPHMSNFREICRTLGELGATRQTLHHGDLLTTLVELLEDSPRRDRMSAAAKIWHESNRGATERTLEVIRAHL